MAPQTHIPIAANVLGCRNPKRYMLGDTKLTSTSSVSEDNRYRLWCVQLVPQIWTNWRTKKTDGLPGSMMFLWAACGPPFGVYAIVQNFNLPIQIQPQIFIALCLISWTQILVYHSKWPTWKACLLGLAVAAVFAGIEAALIITIKPIYSRGNGLPILIVGIVAAILLAVGLLPPYAELWKRRGRVVGINWIFLTMDWFGAFFSLMALVAQDTFDVLGGVLYIICCLLEIGIFASHIIWRIRTRKIREEAAAQGRTFDDIALEHDAQEIPFKFAERKSRRSEPPSGDDEASHRAEGDGAGCDGAGLDGPKASSDHEPGPTAVDR